MDDAALVAVKLRGPRDRAVRHVHEFPIAIDGIGDAGAMFVGEEEEAAVLERFGRLATRDEHGGAEHLGVTGETERDRCPLRRERRGLTRRLLRRRQHDRARREAENDRRQFAHGADSNVSQSTQRWAIPIRVGYLRAGPTPTYYTRGVVLPP